MLRQVALLVQLVLNERDRLRSRVDGDALLLNLDERGSVNVLYLHREHVDKVAGALHRERERRAL